MRDMGLSRAAREPESKGTCKSVPAHGKGRAEHHDLKTDRETYQVLIRQVTNLSLTISLCRVTQSYLFSKLNTIYIAFVQKALELILRIKEPGGGGAHL